jgi:transposase
LGAYVVTVKRLVVRYQQTGELTPRPNPGGQRHIGATQEAMLLERLAAAPDVTVREHCAWWEKTQSQRVSAATMWRALRRLGWTHKNTITVSEWDEEARQAWKVQIASEYVADLVFVDESSTTTALTRLYG